ncbi:hypothetical protein PCE1_001924 [Barthelona sp. PCE]
MRELIVTVKDFEQLASYQQFHTQCSFRINSSHISHAQLDSFLSNYNSTETLKDSPVYIDLQGAKMRLGFNQAEIDIAEGEVVAITTVDEVTTDKVIIIDERAVSFLKQGTVLSIHDGRMIVEVVGQNSVRVLKGGRVERRKGINFQPHPNVPIALSQRDIEFIGICKQYLASNDNIRLALSFSTDKIQLDEIKELIDCHICVKIEKDLSMEKYTELLNNSDSAWICRGDLGAQMGLKDMPKFIYDVAFETARSGKYHFVMAGEVLDGCSFVGHPSRTEICHLYNLKMNGFNGMSLN